jgi:hypothetical protein
MGLIVERCTFCGGEFESCPCIDADLYTDECEHLDLEIHETVPTDYQGRTRLYAVCSQCDYAEEIGAGGGVI